MSAQLYGKANGTVSCVIEFNIGEVEWLFNDNSSTAYRARNHYDSLDQYEICAYWKVSGSNSCNVVPLSSANYLGLLNGGKYYSATFSLPVWSTTTNYIVGVGVFKKTATTSLVASIPGIVTKSVVTSEIQKATFEFDMDPSLVLLLLKISSHNRLILLSSIIRSIHWELTLPSRENRDIHYLNSIFC